MKAKARKNSQSGFTALLTMLFAVLVFMIIMSEAVPSYIQTWKDTEQITAKQRVRAFGNLITAVTICYQTTNCVPSPGLLGQIPSSSAGPIQQGMYSYNMIYSGYPVTTYIYTASPVGNTIPTAGMLWFRVTETNTVTCSSNKGTTWAPC